MNLEYPFFRCGASGRGYTSDTRHTTYRCRGAVRRMFLELVITSQSHFQLPHPLRGEGMSLHFPLVPPNCLFDR